MENKKREQFFDKLNEEEKAVQIPYYLHEGEMYRLERINKRWFVAFLIVLAMLFTTNAAWVIYEMQYEDQVYSYEIQQDSGDGGSVTYTGNTVKMIGGDSYGEADSQDSGQTPGY